MSMNLAPPSKQSLDLESISWASRAASLTIADAESCVHASQLLKSIKGLRAEIANWFAPHVEAAMETKRKAEAARKALVDEKDRMEAPLVQAEGVLKGRLLAWEATQDAIRREHERQLQAEAQRKAEEATLEAAAALELEAQATHNPEMLQEAQDILAQPIEAPVVSVKTLMPHVQGISFRSTWKAHETIDVKALAAAVATGTAPSTFLLPNLSAINNFARATQGTQPVPGVRFFEDRQIAARRG